MKKNGFVLLETIVVIMIVTLSLTVLLSSYALVSRKTKEKFYYNNTSDIYLLYSLSNLGTSTKNSYAKMSNVVISIDNCNYLKEMTGINIFRSGGKDYCKDVFRSAGLKKIYIVDNICDTFKITTNEGYEEEKKDTCKDFKTSEKVQYIIGYNKSEEKINYETAQVKVFDNGAIEYIKTLRRNNADATGNLTSPIKYMIGEFYRNGKYYYASIVL